ncbi:uncharacterized protein LOC127240186 [Andrographis paniculata]|uniref:uncharacterized protein LOC127240186 n=1 Tax=Andrographis paniculata TaxID=175694 RepID=UPI0021E8F20A|nr:uncharacterized protein LOC127240186 [Andrographis paniculata]
MAGWIIRSARGKIMSSDQNESTTTMIWEKVLQMGEVNLPGARWGHTCNAVSGGRRVYVLGGYGQSFSRTDRVDIFFTEYLCWRVAMMRGNPPAPRHSHSCTTVGDRLFVFGGTDGTKPLNDLHILDTASRSWILPSVSGDVPEPREGHSAVLIDKRIFIYGGCGRFENGDVYYNDLHTLDTETFQWKNVVTDGTPPSKREGQSCISWRHNIIVVGGEDSSSSSSPDVHRIHVDNKVWYKMHCTGEILPPRGGHTAIGLGDNLLVFGGVSEESKLYNDVYKLEIGNGTWTKITTIGECPSGRFFMAGDCLDPQRGVLVYIGGCSENLEALNDVYFLHTEPYRGSLAGQESLKLQSVVQNILIPANSKLKSLVQNSEPTP